MLIEKTTEERVKALGRHILVEAFDCDSNSLNDTQLLRTMLLYAAKEANMTVCGEVFHKFSPHGVTGVVVVKESHISIHTWPEYGYASIDIFTCGNYSNPWKAYQYIVETLKPKRIQVIELKRGVLKQEVEG